MILHWDCVISDRALCESLPYHAMPRHVALPMLGAVSLRFASPRLAAGQRHCREGKRACKDGCIVSIDIDL